MSSLLPVKTLKSTYCGFSVQIKDMNKVLYAARFPPSGETSAPNFTTESTDEELRADDHISCQTMVDFINSNDTFQANGNWKGGQYGANNFALTSKVWFSGLFTFDQLNITVVKEGIIKYSGKPFESSQLIIEGSEEKAWSCNAEWQGINYPLYLTDNPMPQIARDVIFIWSCTSTNKTLIKVLRRGIGPNVDMPGKIIPCAGEHVEPGQNDCLREQALWVINQELGIPPETLTNCYLLSLGEYSDEGLTECRDSRYSYYSTLQDGELEQFGFYRGSKTSASIVYLQTEESVEPIEVDPTDFEEISGKWWEDINQVFEIHSDDDWMIKAHQQFIPDAIALIKQLSEQEQELFKF
jgi:hypothetical protein